MTIKEKKNMFSKACEYAIRASIYIASQRIIGNRVSLIDVSNKIDSPEAFTSKILQKLVKFKIIQSIKGPRGGFEIEKNKMEAINLKMIVEAFEGDVLNRCSLGLNECSDMHPCPFHYKYKPIKQNLIHIFESTNLIDLIRQDIEDPTFLKK
ncbi:MAG TPA: Rrf2 family transcriptional regulator [Saprospiraceae bacterium]|nr:Rrf2 family transcriptional regulator [Saprospiraceae bacterium]